jgi:hypothetical protein
VELELLIQKINELRARGIRLIAIEKEVGMPENTLAGMLSRSRPFPKKWQKKLTEYVFSQTLNVPALPQQTVNDLIEKGAAITEISSEGEIKPIDPFSNKGQEIIKQTKTSHKSPPPGLSRTEQLRWYRENAQTLQ